MTRTHATLAIFAAFCAVSLPGCGGADYQVVPVSGKVIYGGKPLAKIHVSFQPRGDAAGRAKPGPGSFGVSDAEGRYTLRTVDPEEDGAVVGTHVVRLARQAEAVDVKNDLSAPRSTLLPEPCRDGSLTFTVPAEGTDAADFDLQSILASRGGQ
jgi:hypothetical protein